MSQPIPTPPQTPPSDPQEPTTRTTASTAAIVAILALVLVLVLLLIGASLLYVTATHPGLAVPFTVAAAGVTIVLTVVGAIATILAPQRR